MADIHILVGCGGSGIRTLRRVNELFREDNSWRRRAPTDVYYVVVDTDTADLEEFKKGVDADFAGLPESPYVAQIALSRGETHLQPLVQRYIVFPFEDGTDAEAQQRLLEHWWNRGPKDPFMAPRVRPLVRGAGQCPPVSYFLTWLKLADIEHEFRDLIGEIQRRKGGLGRYDNINVVFVAGLAGGTGRGCWELVAFKLRQLFTQEYGVAPTPRAFLFDATVFNDIFEKYPTQRLPMMVNSLTGMSQLACWTVNRQQGHRHRDARYRYRLPNLETPGDPETDVLNVDLELDVNAVAPVDHAYLVFRENQLTQLADHFQYYEMAAGAIYAALSKSYIDQQLINQNSSYIGIASATFEVSATRIRKYFEALARVQAVEMLQQRNVQAVLDCEHKFWEKTRLLVDVTDDDPATYYTPDANGTFLQAVLHRLLEESRQKLANLEGALRQQDLEESRRLMNGVLAIDQGVLERVFKDVIAERRLEPVDIAKQLALKLLEETNSVGAIDEFFKKVTIGLRTEIKEMPLELGVGRDDPRKLLEEYADREFPKFWIRFSDQEIKKLLEVTRYAIPRLYYSEIRRALMGHYEKWGKDINILQANVNDIQECLLSLERKYHRACELSVGQVVGTESAFDQLFAPPDQPEKGVDARFAERRFYRRELKPLLQKGDDIKLISGFVEIQGEVFDIVREHLFQHSISDRSEAQQQLERRLDGAIQTSVGLPLGFIEEHFSLRKVVQDIRKAWKARLQEHMSEDQRHHLESRYEEIFGYRPRRRVDTQKIEYEFPESIDDVLCHMAVSLARTCKPFWVLKRRQDEKFRVVVFIPSKINKAQLEANVNGILGLDSAQIDIEVYPESSDSVDHEDAGNPFVMLAYSTQGVESLDAIQSLNYYSQPGVLDMLRRAERDDGDTIFNGGTNGGLGYTDPLYVRDAQVREMRWRPWLEKDTIVQQQKRAVADALLYALFPGDGLLSEFMQQIVNELERIRWTMPLIKHRGGNRYAFARLALTYHDGEVKTNHDVIAQSWAEGDAVAPVAGFDRVFAVLAGQDEQRAERGLAWRDIILKEAEQFWEHVLRRINVARKTPNYRRMLQEYQDWLSSKCHEIPDDSPEKRVWVDLLDQIKERLEKDGKP